MKLKYLRKLGQNKAGDTVDVDDASARYLLDRGLAQAIDDEPADDEPKPTRRRRAAAEGDDQSE
ncbi:DUF7302 family protein [Kineococcus radiotolerans]|uniref:Uncharacterized protein n=1 Tax=Kineococcus radiotolerans (strain ATCC BAA-149 / DSM 14245 / SRS30216) TaxID=266940 RepID=A6W8S3_KINRD|nr:hypothetical protein [Kineococcus radiotolerans]ABS03212.1 hypothetical protein Krad_1726 [Kineococcus radiotolerans SRS30216 = ATCC BAA-149]